VGEARFRVLGDVGLHLLPVTLVVANLFAAAADRQHAGQRLDVGGRRRQVHGDPAKFQIIHDQPGQAGEGGFLLPGQFAGMRIDQVRGQSIEWFISVRVSHSRSAARPILASMVAREPSCEGSPWSCPAEPEMTKSRSLNGSAVLRLGILRVAKAARTVHPLVGCMGRANAGHRQKTRRPEGSSGQPVWPRKQDRFEF